MLEEQVKKKILDIYENYDVIGLVLVIIELEPPSVPFRTRQGNPTSPMVLWLKPRKSRSSPEPNR